MGIVAGKSNCQLEGNPMKRNKFLSHKRLSMDKIKFKIQKCNRANRMWH